MAGLLDYLYDPSTYGGGNGGLLSRLSPSLGAIPQSAGFPQQDQPPQAAPVQVGDYSMPRVGNADLYQPQQAMTPPNATPTQGQMPAPTQAMPADQPGFLPFYQSMKNGGGLIGSIMAGVTGRRMDPVGIQEQRANQTAQYLTTKGFDPALAKTVVSDPALLRAVLPQMIGFGGQTDDIKEYQFAKQQEPGLTFKDWMLRKKATSGEYSLNPTYVVNTKTGKTEAYQLGKDGKPVKVELPEGTEIAAGTEKIDAGTHWNIYDKKSGTIIGTMPKDLQGKEAAEARGKAQGEAQAALPGALADAERTKASIDQLLKHEGLSSIVGPLDQYRPSWSLGEAGNDALARYKQLQGQAFLQAYNLLKGGGAITDIEGKKAEAAMARLDRAQSEETFKEALKDFRDAIESGVNKLKAKAGGTSAAPADSASANLKAKYGLD
jgi:hypothetical protein